MAKKAFEIKIPAKDNKDIVTSVSEFTQANKEIEILPELESFITPLSKDALAQLEENIIAEGIREPLIVWTSEDREILIDGHNRFNIAKKYNLPYKRIRKNFRSLEEVKKWMIQNQLGRRNLTELELSYFRGLLYSQKKGGWGGKRDAEAQAGRTAGIIADEYKVTERTIFRDEMLFQGLEKIGKSNPELKRQILAGDVKVAKGKLQKLSEVEDVESISSLEEINRVLSGLKSLVQEENGSEFDELLKSIKDIIAEIAKSRKAEKVQELEQIISQLKGLLK
jgi:ribosomal protein L15